VMGVIVTGGVGVEMTWNARYRVYSIRLDESSARDCNVAAVDLTHVLANGFSFIRGVSDGEVVAQVSYTAVAGA